MATEPKKNSLPKLRTFANDLETHRGVPNVQKNSGISPATITKTDPIKDTETKKITPATDTKSSPNITTDHNKPDLQSKNSSIAHGTKNEQVANPSPIISTAHSKKLPGVISYTSHTVAGRDSLSSAVAKTINSAPKKDISRDASYDPVIITDTKHKRFRLGHEIVMSLSSWWEEKTKKFSERKKPKYTVPQAERRKGVIQKATSKTGRVASIDHAAVLERIKSNQRHDENKKEKAVVPKVPKFAESEDLPKENEPTIETVTPPTPPISPMVPVINRPPKTPIIQPDISITPVVPPVNIEMTRTDQIDEKTRIGSGSANEQIENLHPIEKEEEIPKETRSPIIPELSTILPKIIPPITPTTGVHSTTFSREERELTKKNPPVTIPRNPLKPHVKSIIPETNRLVKPLDVYSDPSTTSVIPDAVIEKKNTDIPNKKNELRPELENKFLQNENIPARETGDYFVGKIKDPIAPEPIIVLPKIITPTIPTTFNSDSTPEVKKVERVESGPKLAAEPEIKQSIFSKLKLLAGLFRPIQDPNQLVFITIIIMTIIFVTYIGINTFIGSNKSGPVITNAYSPVIFSTAVQYNEVISGEGKAAILAQLQAKNNPEESVTELVFLAPGAKSELAAAELLSLLDYKLDSDFVTSISHVAFGYYRGNPWLVIISNNKSAATGGMLRWETTMSSDLDPLFGPTVRTSKSFGLTNFKDSTISTIDVRALLDSDDVERITYGFLAPNTILITNNSTSFTNLANNFIKR